MGRTKWNRHGATKSPQLGDAGPSWRFHAAVLVLLTVLAYSPAFLAGYIWDDDDYVYDNPNLKSLSGLVNIWLVPRSSPQYYPVVHTTYWLEYRLWGLTPLGYHVTNVLLHAASSLVLWRLLQHLSIPGAWLAAAVFALHPVHVESVAWITERKNVLSLLCYLGSAYCYFQSEHSAPSAISRMRIWYTGSLGLFVLALLCKTVIATLPAAILVILWWKQGRLLLRQIVAVGPMFLIGIPLGLFTAWLEREHVGASGAEWSFSAADRFLIAGRAVWFYAAKLVFPYPLAFIYPRWQIDDQDWRQYLFPAAAIMLVTLLWLLRKRIGRGPVAGVLLFGGTLLPALGFFNVYPMRYSFVADHFQYAASIGLLTVLVGATTVLLSSRTSVLFCRALGGVLLAVLGVLTFQQCFIYRDSESLWRDTLSKNPQSSMVRTNLGQHLRSVGRTEEAVAEFREAIRLAHQQEVIPQHDLAMAQTNLGLGLRELGRIDEAIQSFREAIRLAPEDPVTHNNLALGLIDERNYVEAERRLHRAITISPDYPEAVSNLAVVLQLQGKLEESEAQFRRAIQLDEANALLRYNLGTLLHVQNRAADAVDEYEESVRLQPDFLPARYNLASLLIERGSYRSAEVQLQAILQADPSFPGAKQLLELVHRKLPAE